MNNRQREVDSGYVQSYDNVYYVNYEVKHNDLVRNKLEK